MKQPDLGRKISDLRKAKGLTQEDLVEKCNISVRTLQRIETGEVTPRIYTVRTILAALDCDPGTIVEDDDSPPRVRAGTIRRYIFPEMDDAVSSDVPDRHLTVAWIAGVLYFFLGFFDGAAEVFRYENHRLFMHESYYVVMKIAVLVSFVLFQRGFAILGGIFRNYLLRIMSFVLIVGQIVVIGYDIASVFYDSAERGYILGAEAFTYGGMMIVFGVSLRRLRTTVGDVAGYAGLFEIIAGCFFLTIVLSFIGFFVLMPAELLEIIILYKSMDIVKSTHPADSTGALSHAGG